jgi:hypothetical protein
MSNQRDNDPPELITMNSSRREILPYSFDHWTSGGDPAEGQCVVASAFQWTVARR